MKKFLLFLIIAATLISTAAARDFRIIAFGAKAGINLSSASGIPDLIGTMKPNFTGGLCFEFRPIKWVGLSAELLYTGAGFKTKPLNDNGDVIDAKYNFIDIPVMVRAYIAGGLSVNVGVQASFAFSPTLSYNELRSQFETQKAIFAIPVGLSYSFGFGLMLEARYTFGLTDIVHGRSYQTTKGVVNLPSVRSDSFAFTVGWRIFGI